MTNTFYPGNIVVSTATFTDVNGNPVDPTNIQITYTFTPPGSVTVWTYALGQVTRVSQGVYTANIDTTTHPASSCYLVWAGTGANQASYFDNFTVQGN